MTVLDQFGAFVAAPKRLPEAVERAARRHVLDIVGAWIAGRATAEGEALTRYGARALGQSGADRAVVHCGHARLSEIDDIHLSSLTTPGAIVVPTTLVMARAERLDHAAVVEAIVGGYEAMIRLGMAVDGPKILYRGIWPTYLAAPFGAAAVAARLLRLSDAQAANALALALSLASPAVGHQAGAATSRWLACGLAVRNGVGAALAARDGFIADRGLLDGGAFATTYSANPTALIQGLGEDHAVLDVSFKPWCAARQTMAATQGLIELLADGVAVGDIAEIAVAIPPVQQKMIDHGVNAGERLTYLTSLPYMLATAVLAPDAKFDIRPTPQRSPDIQAVMAKVKVNADDSLMAEYPAVWPARVTVRTASGTREKLVRQVPGDPARPLDERQLLDKLRRVIAAATSPAAAQAVLASAAPLLADGDVVDAAATALRAGGVSL